MKSRYLLVAFLFLTVSISAQNILIGNNGNPNEPSIMINPTHPEYLIAAANINKYYVSIDTGHTWVTHILTSSQGVWGDPVIDVDTSGNFYFFHLSNPSNGNWIDRIVCQKTTDNGDTWTDGSFTGLNGTKAQDKQWSTIDRNTNYIYLTWTQFDDYGSENPADSSLILFSKSIDEGDTWSTPKRLNKVAGNCIDSNDTVEGAVPSIGPNGEIYVSWAGPKGLVFDKSTDDGDTWLTDDILIDEMPTGWDYAIPGIYRANGLPITKCDISGGTHNGTIYVNWSDQRNGSDDTDIWLAKSTDNGNTWTNPIRVNDDPAGKQQFFTWMDIDQTTGYLYFVFYDRRAYEDTQTDVYLAVSTDGGNTFENIKISESPFIPYDGIFFGDYTNITAHNGIIRPIWTRLHNAQLSIWTDVTPMEVISKVKSEINNLDKHQVTQYPNPTKNESYVSFKLHETADIHLALFDAKGKKVYTIIDNEKRNYGKHIIPINIDNLHLASGSYYCKLSINGASKTLKMIVIE